MFHSLVEKKKVVKKLLIVLDNIFVKSITYFVLDSGLEEMVKRIYTRVLMNG